MGRVMHSAARARQEAPICVAVAAPPLARFPEASRGPCAAAASRYAGLAGLPQSPGAQTPPGSMQAATALLPGLQGPLPSLDSSLPLSPSAAAPPNKMVSLELLLGTPSTPLGPDPLLPVSVAAAAACRQARPAAGATPGGCRLL